MFRIVCRNSLKTLIRSWTFWLALAAFAGLMLREGMMDYVIYAPGYEPTILSYETYVQGIAHRMSSELRFALPFLAGVMTALLFIHDWDDGFFEIEKAAGVRTGSYLFGRLSVVTALVSTAQWLCSIVAIAVYVFRWSGVRGLSGGAFLADCAWRLFQVTVCAALPIILVCVAGTYLIGLLLRNGFSASVGMLILTLANYVFTMLYQYRDFEMYFDYFCPNPRMLFRYVVYYGTADTELQRMGATLGSAVFCVAWQLLIFLLLVLALYRQVSKREM